MSDSPDAPRRKRDEWGLFLFITVILFPALSVAIIGTWGLGVWISHALGG